MRVYLNFALPRAVGLHMVVCKKLACLLFMLRGGSVPGFACGLLYERHILGEALNKHLHWLKYHLMSVS